LALRQSEGLIGSIMKMLEIDLPVPDNTTLFPIRAVSRT
jgi:hypothetical protein